MKYTLTYRNKQGVEARLDIITFGSTSTTETIEGTDTPFILNYKREKNDKEGYIISSSADIAIYESGTFNIDTLKTSNETDIKVEYYIDNVLTWSGFVVPDFFSRVIGTPAIVNMVASDRLGSLKGQTLSGLPAMVTLSSLVSSCLSKTGLSLPVNLKADFTSVVGNENVFASKVISQRFTDTKGRNISCYDILRSILVMTNSVVVQRNGQWYVANKIQIEQGTALPTTQYIDFDEVSVGARRQIMPVASSVGVYHEFGGERKHPQNFDFSEALSGWTAVNGFIAQVNNKEIIGFNYSDTEINPIFGTNDTLPYLLSVNTNPANKLVYTNPETGWNFEAAPYLKATFPVISLDQNIVNINFDVGVIGIFRSYYPFVIIARNRNDANDIYALNSKGLFIPYDFHSDDFLLSSYLGGENYTTPIPGARKISGKLEVDNVTNYDIEIRIYQASIIKPQGYFGDVTLAINFSSVTFNNETEIPKGNIYKTTQGDNFTKVHETDTTVIGDYRTSGLNGYGYPYPIDDTSSLLTSTGLLTERWTAPDNANELPILQHVTRQRAKMFSIAHDLLTAEIDSDVLDPLATFRDCSGKKYVMVSGSQDFLRGTINVEIEEIAYSTTIWKQDYIYSYFGEGEEGISSVGGISESAPSAGGGGMTPEQLEMLNESIKDVITSTDEITTFTDDNLLSSLRVMKEISDVKDETIVTSDDVETELTDNNVLSSLRSLKEILDNNEYLRTQFLSKVSEDTAAEVITFLKGLITASLEVGGESLFRGLARFLEGVQFGESFIPGLNGIGGKIFGDGKAELDALTLRKWLEVPELRYNRVEVTIGDKWSSPGAGIIESVDTENKVIKLKLEEGEIGTFDVDDICMGIYHSMISGDNAISNYDDSKGNRRFAGFATSYFRIIQVMDQRKSTLRYELRHVSGSHPNPVHPSQFMHAVAYGNFTNAERQTSNYQTRTYTRYLKGVNDWEFNVSNIAAQFGDLSNLNVFGLNMSGYSMYLNNVYFTGIIHQLSEQVQAELNKHQVGGKNLLREYDIRFGFKYWGGTGEFIEVNLDTLQNQPYLNVSPAQIIWVFPEREADVNVESNTNWLVE